MMDKNFSTNKNSFKKSIYDRIGGRQTLEKVLTIFFQYILNDNSLNSFFIQKISSFTFHFKIFVNTFSQILGGPQTIKIQSLMKAHNNILIREAQFDLVWKYLQKSFQNYGLNERVIQEIRTQVYKISHLIINEIRTEKKISEKKSKLLKKRSAFQQYCKQNNHA